MANLSGENGLDATMLVQPSGGYNYGGYPIAMPFYGGNYGGFGGGNGIFGGDFGAIIALFFFVMMFGGFGGRCTGGAFCGSRCLLLNEASSGRAWGIGGSPCFNPPHEGV